eukprot:COSAG02_NODE_726_length_18005_cov_69.224897_4_plen_365_part_00
MLLTAAGTDASDLFNALHQPHALKNVEQHLMGRLEQDDEAQPDGKAGDQMPAGFGNIGLTTMAAPEEASQPSEPRPAATTNLLTTDTATPLTVQLVLPDSLAQMTPEQLAAFGASLTAGVVGTLPPNAAGQQGTSPSDTPADDRKVKPTNLQAIINIDQMQAASDDRVDDAVRVWWEHGGENEQTFRANLAAWDNFAIRPTILTDVSAPVLATKILGYPIALPLCFSPVSFHTLAHPDGERATAAAAAKMQIGLGISSSSTTDLADVASAAAAVDPTAILFFQLYVPKLANAPGMDREVVKKLLDYASDNGFVAVFVTLDQNVNGNRWCEPWNPDVASCVIHCFLQTCLNSDLAAADLQAYLSR